MTSGSEDLCSELRTVGLEVRADAGTRAMHSSDASPYAFRHKRWCADDILPACPWAAVTAYPSPRVVPARRRATPSGRATCSTSPAPQAA